MPLIPRRNNKTRLVGGQTTLSGEKLPLCPKKPPKSSPPIRNALAAADAQLEAERDALCQAELEKAIEAESNQPPLTPDEWNTPCITGVAPSFEYLFERIRDRVVGLVRVRTCARAALYRARQKKSDSFHVGGVSFYSLIFVPTDK